MKIYKLKLKPKSSHITPWQSDTIFGSLCWILAQRDGAKSLQSFLDEYWSGHFPLVISGGFPADYLPRPLAGNFFSVKEGMNKKEALELARKEKVVRKTTLVSLEEFNDIINGRNTFIRPKEKLNTVAGVMHNQISRLTGAAADGGLYEHQEIFWDDTHISLYLGIEDGWQDKVYDLFYALSLRGFGSRASTGKGHFTIEDFGEFNGFGLTGKANSFVVMSNYVPKTGDPLDGQYKTFVKYGKLGQSYAHSENPFKKPLLMIIPGSVFWTERPSFAYGRLVKNISPGFPEVVQCGCTLAIPAFINKDQVF